jgi:DNA repair protein RecO (recombination protein O)
LTLLTPEFGKIDAIAKGARKGGSRLAGMSDPLSCSLLYLNFSRNTRYVTQSQPLTSFAQLRKDYDRLSYALALSELYASVIPYEEEQPDPFNLFVASIKTIEDHKKPIVAYLWSQLKLMDLAGFMPQWATCCISGCGVKEATPWLSPSAGGYVCQANALEYVDRFSTRAEVLYGLSRLSELDMPPSHLKLAGESNRVLSKFWVHIVERPLPATEQAVQLSAETDAGSPKV